MPRYQFEWGRYPLVMQEATLELDNHEQARQVADELGAAYVFDLPEDRNPDEVYARPYTKEEYEAMNKVSFTSSSLEDFLILQDDLTK